MSAPPGTPPDDTVQRSVAAQEDDYYALPPEVADWINTFQKRIPSGWRLVPWTINRAVTLKNSRDEVHHVFTYEYIEDGGAFYLENNQQM